MVLLISLLFVSCGLLEASVDGAIVGGAAAGGAAVSPVTAFIAAVLGFFGVRLWRTQEDVDVAEGTIRDIATGNTGFGNNLISFLENVGIIIAVFLLLGYVLYRQRVGQKNYTLIDEIRTRLGMNDEDTDS